MSSLYKKLTVCCLMLCMLTGCAGSRQAMSGQADVVDETTERTDTERADTGKEKEPDIVCWGDSLTYGTGGEGVTYPSVLADETGLTVYNYGVCGEKADQIAVRMGLYPMTTGAFTIPAEREPVALSLLCDGEDPIMLRLGDAGMNPCDIAGVKGELSYSEEDGNYYFTRQTKGDAVTVSDGAVVTMDAAGKIDPDDIVVLFIGSNDRPTAEDAETLIATEKEMIRYLGSSKYIVVGLTSKEMIPEVAAVNEKLAAAFGTHFLDIRSYLLNMD